jgi:hypothetical protein
MFCSLGIRCIILIFFAVCFFKGAMAIEVSFSAEDGGESVGISDEYNVSTGVSVSEESEANFGNVEMTSSRRIAGSGDANAVQRYSGSSGYFGQAELDASGISGTLKSRLLANFCGQGIKFIMAMDQINSCVNLSRRTV